MSNLDNKKKIFGNLAAAKTLTNGVPKLKLNSSFPSINNSGNSLDFLIDLLISLTGISTLMSTVVDILTYSLPKIEIKIKKALKIELKSIVSCGVDPNIPTFLKSTGSGIIIKVKDIDFIDLFKVNPTSLSGDLLYNDITSPLSNSTDLNTFLFDVIQNDSTTMSWNNILDVTFNSVGVNGNPNNTLTIKTNPSYDNKTLTDLNNDFINSISLFGDADVLNRIIDSIFGSISANLKKSRKQLELEEKINNVIDNIVNATEETSDDSYFVFDNDEVYIQEEKATNRKNGIMKLECCNKIASTVPIESLSAFTTDIQSSTSTQNKKEIITKHLSNMASASSSNTENPSDVASVKTNFIIEILKNIVKSIVNIVISPKIILIFLVNFKIIYGANGSFDGPIDFMKKNKNLFKSIIKEISGIIIKMLLVLAIKEITSLVAKAQLKKMADKNKGKVSQILSLVGAPQEAIRLLKGLS